MMWWQFIKDQIVNFVEKARSGIQCVVQNKAWADFLSVIYYALVGGYLIYVFDESPPPNIQELLKADGCPIQ